MNEKRTKLFAVLWPSPNHRAKEVSNAFTIVELLVATAILMVILGVTLSLTSQISGIWSQAETRTTAFQNARFANERIIRSLSQASLNPYLDYIDNSGNRRTSNNFNNFVPVDYQRQSDQHFLITNASSFTPSGVTWACFFQAPLGATANTNLSHLDNLLNAVGFFVEFNSDSDATTISSKPSFVGETKWRYRLMELVQPSESLGVYSNYTNSSWIAGAMGSGRNARPIAENVIALIFQAKDTDGGNLPNAGQYSYDSRDELQPNTLHQLPSEVQVTIITIDEKSAKRLAAIHGTSPPDFGLSGKFLNPANFTEDLKDLEAALQNNPTHPDYRIFNSTVRLESAKWSH